MRATAIIAFLTTLYTTQITADMTLRYDALLPDRQLPVHSLAVKQERVRLDHLQGYRPPSVMLDLASGEIVKLDQRNRSYFKINAQTLNQYLSIYRSNHELIQGLINQGLQQLDPEKRQQYEDMVAQLRQPADSAMQIRPTEQTDRVLGIECRVLSLFEQDRHIRDICISDYQQLDLSAADTQSLEKLRQFIRQFGQSAPGPQQDLLAFVAQGLKQTAGLPVKVVNYHANGEVRDIIQLAKISLRKIDDEVYQIPRHYEEQLTPFVSSRW